MPALRHTAAVLAAVGATAACLAAPAYADIAVLRATMTGANEVPVHGEPSATGSSVVTLNSHTGRVCYFVHETGIAEAVTAGHIHRGAAGTAGPVVIPFRAPRHGVTAGCTTADRTLVQSIIDNPSGFYTNLHSLTFPGGAIRGQLTAVTVVRTPQPGGAAHARLLRHR